MMQAKTIDILQLYPNDMNIYGDWGNTLTLKMRAKWHGIEVNLISYNPGDIFPKSPDLIIGGGGQDSGQTRIQDDLLSSSEKLHGLANSGTPMLLICGLYQLFGHFFKTKDNIIIKGIGILDIETHAGDVRLIGNIRTKSSKFGEVVGYENHSGLTYLGKEAQAFGTVIQGAGNNGQDATEGAVFNNVIGTYLHGPILPKNPAIADWLIEQAMIKKYGEFRPTVIDDRFADQARRIALSRPR